MKVIDRRRIILLTAYCLVLSVTSADPPGWTEGSIR